MSPNREETGHQHQHPQQRRIDEGEPHLAIVGVADVVLAAGCRHRRHHRLGRHLPLEVEVRVVGGQVPQAEDLVDDAVHPPGLLHDALAQLLALLGLDPLPEGDEGGGGARDAGKGSAQLMGQRQQHPGAGLAVGRALSRSLVLEVFVEAGQDL